MCPNVRLAARWLRAGGAELQQRAAALPKAGHGDGTSKLSVLCSPSAGMRSLCSSGTECSTCLGGEGVGRGHQAGFPVAEVVFAEGRCAVHGVVVGTRRTRGLCCWERCWLVVCLPVQHLQTLGCCLCWAHPCSLVPARWDTLVLPSCRGGRGTAAEQRVR